MKSKQSTSVTRRCWYRIQGGPPLATPKVYDRVQTLLMFIGYPRSGHTLVGSLIDAHPNAIIANELDIIGSWLEWNEDNRNKYFLFDQLYKNSHEQAIKGYRSRFNEYVMQQLFNYSVFRQWQGKFKDAPKVIGDKHGPATTLWLTMRIYGRPTFEQIKAKVNAKVKFIHVIRNPFDNISTMLIRTKKLRHDIERSKGKINDTESLEFEILRYFNLAAGNEVLIEKWRENILEIHSKDLISKPRDTIRRVCNFLDLTCSKQYLDDCASIVYKKPSKTRFRVLWTDKQKQRTLQAIRRFAFLKGYTFESL
ncbi:predicted protein [Nematostella vectensis]|uniref:Protein-tyrosine sulfotransferase n=2 Tax=Nematostella vectensis TaxID=45351 RepID=A7SXA4_NEMVE|nr:predicted protein [Nematostella vectensis]|eukprot:XP_001623772.1 predicted protein [Nematostella vectensis]